MSRFSFSTSIANHFRPTTYHFSGSDISTLDGSSSDYIFGKFANNCVLKMSPLSRDNLLQLDIRRPR